jgi:hypothetical protein
VANPGDLAVTLPGKQAIKTILGDMPLTAELYWHLRQQGKPLSKSASLRRTQKWLPTWLAQAKAAARLADRPAQHVMLFSTLRYWLEYGTLLGCAFAGLGHRVAHTYLPYTNWRKPLNRFDLRRQSAYIRSVLDPAEPFLKPVNLLDVRTDHRQLPPDVQAAIEEVSLRDAQYTLQIENVELEGASDSARLYHLRLERNLQAAQAALAWMQANRPDVVVTPNGSILEMGAVYQVARYLDIPVVTYEFGEQRDRIWLARNAEVMRQETDALWAARGHLPLNENQWEQTKALFASRQRASLWENFSRRWQGQPNVGGEKVRQELGLDHRPVILLAANVIGDSLTLGRQMFSQSMTEWLERTASHLAGNPEVQLVIRIHPGERYTKGPSVANVVQSVLPDMPEHIHLVGADDPINTYDLVEIADLGLVYTTTVGMEMAMSGVPVIVAGQTHYRGKGFTLDPNTWEGYLQQLEEVIKDPQAFKCSRQQVEQAWNYAYRFFFEYPLPFPWHLLHFWNELENWSIEKVLTPEGRTQFEPTFEVLLGRPRNWTRDREE